MACMVVFYFKFVMKLCAAGRAARSSSILSDRPGEFLNSSGATNGPESGDG